MTPKNITYGDLVWLLTEVGFRVGHTTGDHLLFENPAFDSVIILPGRRPDESVDAAHLIAVRKNLTEKDITDASTFDSMLETHTNMEGQTVLLSERS